MGEDQEAAEGAPLADDVEVPNWLSDLGSEESAESEEVTPAQAFAADDATLADEGDLADWLSDLGGEEAAEPQEVTPAQAFATDDAEGLPDWLSAGEDEVAEAIPTFTSDDAGKDLDGFETVEPDDGIPTFPVTDELPEWLSEIDGIDTSLPEEASPQTAPESESMKVDESRAVPSWLRNFEETSVDEVPLEEEFEADLFDTVSPDLGDELEDGLTEFDQLPAWLSESPQLDDEPLRESAEPSGDIEEAELPGWLAAMRPVESSAPSPDGEQRGPVESAGPLAGLHNVLAAAPEISRLKKPPVYSNKLQISEAQQEHATLLRDLLKAEGKPQALPLPPLISSQRVFRFGLGILLLIIAFIAVVISGDRMAMPTPDVVPPSVLQTYQLVTQLTPQDTALVAFDYEPGLVGEMDSAAAAVMDNLMKQGVKLALVTTSPTGTALGERFINDVQGNHNYISNTQYVNLGYIPGGISGLAAFAQNPHRILPNTLDGTQAWETEPIQDIQSISDFSLVLLITDNPNTTRAWVEQVNPHLDLVPLVAIVSAQVEPMALPYYSRTNDSQIDGLVSGLTGGAGYEVISGSPNLARLQWDAFNIILIVAVSAILIGGLISIGSTFMTRRKDTEGESA
jgi:hypothetical protein